MESRRGERVIPGLWLGVVLEPLVIWIGAGVSVRKECCCESGDRQMGEEEEAWRARRSVVDGGVAAATMVEAVDGSAVTMSGMAAKRPAETRSALSSALIRVISPPIASETCTLHLHPRT